MSQKKNLNRTVKITFSFFISLIIFSCAQKPNGIRVIKQTDSVAATPSTAEAKQEATNQNLNYTIATLDYTEKIENNDGSFSFQSEIKTPSNKYYPISVTLFDLKPASGQIIDKDNNVTLKIQSQCVNQQCSPLVLLINVLKNNNTYHQIIAISKSDENTFLREELNFTTLTKAKKSFYQNISEVIKSHQLQ